MVLSFPKGVYPEPYREQSKESYLDYVITPLISFGYPARWIKDPARKGTRLLVYIVPKKTNQNNPNKIIKWELHL